MKLIKCYAFAGVVCCCASVGYCSDKTSMGQLPAEISALTHKLGEIEMKYLVRQDNFTIEK